MGGSGQGEQMAGGGPGVQPGVGAVHQHSARSCGEVRQLRLPQDTAGLRWGKDSCALSSLEPLRWLLPQLQVATAEY